MWNKQLARLAGGYTTGVLSIVDATGYPLSVRCAPQMDAANQRFTFPDIAPFAAAWRGKACLLFHQHNQRLEGLRQMVIKGELTDDAGVLTLRVDDFVTANGRQDSDVMAHAGAPLHMLQFMLLGQRKARVYLAKRGAPWPPIPYDEIDRAMKEDAQRRQRAEG
ncbi:MAG TPA: hypothetical protein VMV29_10675 [Ktedonobacterales bacterium]|nr:hypothetical protein [Ktedonobacterales bacterium]